MNKVMAINPEAAGDDWESMESMVVRELDMINDRAEGRDIDRAVDYIPTGLTDLDEMLDGGLITLEKAKVIMYRPHDGS